ncbi:MAG: FlgD immunoglobulin-like domain containing protein, partial [Candidatus Eiseniibacteriota bacterium]
EILGLGPGLPAARLSFDLAADSPVRLGLFDVTGHLVRQLHDGALAAGRHTIAWNGRDAGGDLVPSGVYVARLEVAWGVETGKVLVLR